jgi:hypothetical protein
LAVLRLDRTTSDSSPDSAFAITSARLKLKYSISGSLLSTRKGNTANRVMARASVTGAPVSSVRVALNASAKDAMSRYRSDGAFASARRTTRSSAHTAGDPASTGGGSWTTAWINSASVAPEKGGRPVSISNKIAPSEYTSARTSNGRASSCSGAA